MTFLDSRVPPVLVFATAAALMGLVSRLATSLQLVLPGRALIALALVAMGAATALAGVVAFRRAATTVNPVRPEGVSALVRSGVYRLTRNPMYLGFLLALVGWAVWLGSPLSLVVAGLFAVYMNRFQIGPEERALRAKFGEDFERYARSTRRWL